MSKSSNLLARKAMLGHLNITQWSARKLDRDVTDELNDQKNAKADASRVNKHLLPKDALLPISTVAGAMRAEFTKLTLPWLADGARILPVTSVKKLTAVLRDKSDEFNAEVAKFVANYPGYLQRASNDLGDMFKATDYPKASEIEKKFSMEFKVMPIPSGDDFRVQLAEEELALLRSEVEKNVGQAAEDAVKDIYRRVADVTERMVERLTKYRPARGKGDKSEGTFKDSLVTNISDLVSILPALNVVDDDRVAHITARLESLSKTTPKELRENAGARDSAREEAERILKLVSDWAQ